MMKATFIVKLEMPKDVTHFQMATYIRDAIRCWKGGYSLNDPLLALKSRTVTVKRGDK